jgi:hypothetical protein
VKAAWKVGRSGVSWHEKIPSILYLSGLLVKNIQNAYDNAINLACKDTLDGWYKKGGFVNAITGAACFSILPSVYHGRREKYPLF